jgi:NTE family protein
MAGTAYHAGTLAALAEATGWDPRTAQVVVGTSAGSVTGSLLRAGVPAPDLEARITGAPLTPQGERLLSRAGRAAAAVSGDLSPGPRSRRGSTALLRRALLRPGSVRLSSAVAAALPPGRVPTNGLVAGLRGVLGASWPSRATWLCAVRLEDGSLVVFGREGSPPAGWPEAVAASCAIPAYFQPVEIGGHAYVDGGVHSVTNADLLAREELDLVIVSAPMAVQAGGLRLGLDLPVRAVSAARLRSELLALRRAGVPVVAFRPTAADRRVMGLNLMDGSRRRPVAVRARESALAWLRSAEARRRLEPIFG